MPIMGEMSDFLFDQMSIKDEEDCKMEQSSDLRHGYCFLFNKTCKFCNKSNLHWKLNNKKKWRLYENNGLLHDCSEHPLSSKETNKMNMQNKEQFRDLIEMSTISWDEYFMRMVYLVSTKSKDPRTKIGAVLVKENRVISTGFNGFPIGVNDLKERYYDRSIKNKYVVHAEDNAILCAARFGISTANSVLYTNGIPCNTCAQSVIQGGIQAVIIHKQWPDMDYDSWIEAINITKKMFEEAGIIINVFDKKLFLYGFLDGKTIEV